MIVAILGADVWYSMASAQKKVIVRAAEGGLAWGYLPTEGFLRSGMVELMGVNGKIIPIAISEIRTIAYVRDFNLDDREDPERIGKRTFAARPRGDGLWLRLLFNEAEPLEGLAEFGLGMMDSLIGDQGLFLTPPDTRGNTLRIFVPRAALRAVEVLGWVTAPSKRLAAKAKVEGQGSLFEE
jgi:hypothetical protein